MTFLKAFCELGSFLGASVGYFEMPFCQLKFLSGNYILINYIINSIIFENVFWIFYMSKRSILARKFIFQLVYINIAVVSFIEPSLKQGITNSQSGCLQLGNNWQSFETSRLSAVNILLCYVSKHSVLNLNSLATTPWSLFIFFNILILCKMRVYYCKTKDIVLDNNNNNVKRKTLYQIIMSQI